MYFINFIVFIFFLYIYIYILLTRYLIPSYIILLFLNLHQSSIIINIPLYCCFAQQFLQYITNVFEFIILLPNTNTYFNCSHLTTLIWYNDIPFHILESWLRPGFARVMVFPLCRYMITYVFY